MPSFFCAASDKIKGNVANRSPKENFWGYLTHLCKIFIGLMSSNSVRSLMVIHLTFSSGPLAQVPGDIPLNYIRTAVLYMSDPHFSVST